MTTMTYTGERLIKPRRGFNFEDVYYEHLYRYELAGRFCRGARVLDVACGTGYGSHYLAQRARWVAGADLSQEALHFCREQYGSARTHFVHMDAACLGFRDASFDRVVSFETLEHITEQRAFLGEIRRVLVPGGLAIISTPDREHYNCTEQSNPYHEKELTLEEFRRLFGAVFEEIGWWGQETAADQGARKARYERQTPGIRMGMRIALKRLLFANPMLYGLFPYVSGKRRALHPVPLREGEGYKYLIAVGRKQP